ncbi:unnamed protein product [Onchocerca flexuosa]|uniref:Ovule protein n=1 Tax=Onchocerca flexuosa TaxID=387005 RepID=A0A183I476_9BILA|nr:unnamed protein product [Onchocerca flexuosa]
MEAWGMMNNLRVRNRKSNITYKSPCLCIDSTPQFSSSKFGFTTYSPLMSDPLFMSYIQLLSVIYSSKSLLNSSVSFPGDSPLTCCLRLLQIFLRIGIKSVSFKGIGRTCKTEMFNSIERLAQLLHESVKSDFDLN